MNNCLFCNARLQCGTDVPTASNVSEMLLSCVSALHQDHSGRWYRCRSHLHCHSEASNGKCSFDISSLECSAAAVAFISAVPEGSKCNVTYRSSCVTVSTQERHFSAGDDSATGGGSSGAHDKSIADTGFWGRMKNKFVGKGNKECGAESSTAVKSEAASALTAVAQAVAGATSSLCRDTANVRLTCTDSRPVCGDCCEFIRSSVVRVRSSGSNDDISSSTKANIALVLLLVSLFIIILLVLLHFLGVLKHSGQ